MSPLSLGSMVLTNTESGVHDGGFPDDETIGEEFADVLARVGVGDFCCLVGVKPDLAFAAAEDLGGESLLGAKVRHCCQVLVVMSKLRWC